MGDPDNPQPRDPHLVGGPDGEGCGCLATGQHSQRLMEKVGGTEMFPLAPPADSIHTRAGICQAHLAATECYQSHCSKGFIHVNFTMQIMWPDNDSFNKI